MNIIREAIEVLAELTSLALMLLALAVCAGIYTGVLQ